MRRHPESNKQVIIIGGGASGLAAACLCTAKEVSVTLLEKENRVGRKLLATGNGRCNLMHTGNPVFFGDTAFARAVMAHCGPERVMGFWEDLGLVMRTEEDGRVYPATNQAATVLDCLRLRLEASPLCAVKTGAFVINIKKTAKGFAVDTKEGTHFEAPLVLVASGGAAAPKLGGSDNLMGPLSRLGHRVIPFHPALCPLETDTRAIRGLSGLRVTAHLGLMVREQVVAASSGEALFTDYGVSGLCAMQLARDAGEALEAGLLAKLVIDFSPGLGLSSAHMCRISPDAFVAQAAKAREALRKMLPARARRLGKSLLYVGLLPRLLANKVQSLPFDEAAGWLTGLELNITDIRGFDQAQVASGGLNCRDFDPATLASRRVPGLYAAGEVLNVDGDCGGYNLLFAWATGILAAEDITKRI
ncbi:MAG: aminoacetone oxidase family FAD-binding enzyme [Christensenellales bacterium]